APQIRCYTPMWSSTSCLSPRRSSRVFCRDSPPQSPMIAGVTTASGFQRGDGRELGGFRDGLRNTTSTDRAFVVFVDRDEAPDEPDWLQDGTYMAYLRVREDVDALTLLPLEQQEKIFG